MFAVRRSLYTPLARDTVVDDFVTVMRIVELGYRIRYAPDAKGWERAAATVRDELKRKVRIIAGGWQALAQMRSLLNPLRHPAIALQLISTRSSAGWSLSASSEQPARRWLSWAPPSIGSRWERRYSSTGSHSHRSSRQDSAAAESATSRTISAR